MSRSWETFCLSFSYYEAVEMALDLSRLDISEDEINFLESPFEKAFTAMSELEEGGIANPDENRLVGHYWLRNPELAPSEEIKAAILDCQQNINAFVNKVISGHIAPQTGARFTNAVIVGIGGSALGPQLLQDVFWKKSQPIQLHFCDNTDPDGFSRLLSQLENLLAETLVIVISKSGNTVETKNGETMLAAAYADAGLSFEQHAVAITSPGSHLDKKAISDGWLMSLPIWDWVGGRTSIFSAVGLLPGGLIGIDPEKMLTGARTMDALTRKASLADNPAAKLAAAWFMVGDGMGKRDMVVLPYKDRLLLFSRYLQQLVMESLGKEKNLKGEVVHQGISVFGNKGSTDQHAFVQQLRDGLDNFFVTFIQVLKDQTKFAEGTLPDSKELDTPNSGDYLRGFLLGTREALSENKRPSITIKLHQLEEHSFGALLALFERAVGYYALLININAYHQPGVEAGKKGAAKNIELQKKLKAFASENAGAQTMFSAEELAKELEVPEEAESIYQILEHLSLNPGRGVSREGQAHPRHAKFTLS